MSSFAALLQAAVSLLTLVSASGVPPATRQEALLVAQQVVAFVQAQIPQTIGTPITDTAAPSTDVNVDTVNGTQYFLPGGGWAHPDVPTADGTAISIRDEYSSFGDLNADDNYDDAVVVLQLTRPDTAPQYYLATLMNNSGALAHTDLDILPAFTDILEHRIMLGMFKIELQLPHTLTRRIFTYTYATGTLVLQ